MKVPRLSMQILLIEDDSAVADFIKKGLQQVGHCIEHMSNGKQGLSTAIDNDFDLLIVDRMLPELDGLSIVKALRAIGKDCPIIFLSALGDVDERVKGLKAGGDDYLVKPFAFSELLARIEVLAKRAPKMLPTKETMLTFSDLRMDLLKRKVTRGDRVIELHTKEFNLLEQLVRNAGQVFTRTMLLESIWGYHFDTKTNVIDVHISNLRKKIDEGSSSPILQTVRGTGYKVDHHVK